MTFDRYMWLSIVFLITALTVTIITDWKGIWERANIPLFAKLGNIFGVLFMFFGAYASWRKSRDIAYKKKE